MNCELCRNCKCENNIKRVGTASLSFENIKKGYVSLEISQNIIHEKSLSEDIQMEHNISSSH